MQRSMLQFSCRSPPSHGDTCLERVLRRGHCSTYVENMRLFVCGGLCVTPTTLHLKNVRAEPDELCDRLYGIQCVCDEYDSKAKMTFPSY